MASEIVKLVEIGNSKGIRLPSRLIRRYGIEEELQLVERAEGLLLRPIRSGKLNFEESFRQMAADSDAIAEAASLQGTLADGLEAEEWPNIIAPPSRRRTNKDR
jgi:antitoxin component of MazEF toxin-antitoxin module